MKFQHTFFLISNKTSIEKNWTSSSRWWTLWTMKQIQEDQVLEEIETKKSATAVQFNTHYWVIQIIMCIQTFYVQKNTPKIIWAPTCFCCRRICTTHNKSSIIRLLSVIYICWSWFTLLHDDYHDQPYLKFATFDSNLNFVA